MDSAGGKLLRTELHLRIPLGAEAELVAVHVVAVGDRERDVDAALRGARAEAEGLLRLEELLVLAEELRQRGNREGKQEQPGEEPLHALVSAATQSR
jgi:hypothetical protein